MTTSERRSTLLDEVFLKTSKTLEVQNSPGQPKAKTAFRSLLLKLNDSE